MAGEGMFDKAKGAAEIAVGKVTGDKKLEFEGHIDKAKGAVEDLVDKAKDGVENAKDKLGENFGK